MTTSVVRVEQRGSELGGDFNNTRGPTPMSEELRSLGRQHPGLRAPRQPRSNIARDKRFFTCVTNAIRTLFPYDEWIRQGSVASKNR